jgi:hypothetical protein
VAQKSRDFVRPHLLRVPLSMKQDVAPDPVDVSLLGAVTVMMAADRLAHSVEQPVPGRNIRM